VGNPCGGGRILDKVWLLTYNDQSIIGTSNAVELGVGIDFGVGVL
jgi:hypothetical protein